MTAPRLHPPPVHPAHPAHPTAPRHPTRPNHPERPGPSQPSGSTAPRRPQQPSWGGTPGLTAAPSHLDELAALRRLVLALAIALRVGDRGAAKLVAARLRRCLGRLARLESVVGPPWTAAAVATLRTHARAARQLLAEVPAELRAVDLHRLHRWFVAPNRLGAAGGADLFELDASGKDLTSSSLTQLHLMRCNLLGSKLARSSFREGMLEECDLTSADARFTCWEGAGLARCRLRGASLFEAELTGLVVSDCDLRGADLGARSGGAGAARSIWVRCDLRDTIWTHRSLRGAHFVGCRLAGARDLLTAEGTSVVRCELSGPPPRPSSALPLREVARRWLQTSAAACGGEGAR